MTESLPNPRYERKFIAQGSTLADVLRMVRLHPFLFREVFPTRVVNNIYLDSPGLSDYFDHINGAANRVKTRIRWYGDMKGNIEFPVLERKIKRGLVSGKASFRLPAFSINGSVTLPDVSDHENAALRETLLHLKPSLLNRYSRHYFLSADGHLRLTVDYDLEFKDLRHGLHPRSSLSPQTTIIIEVKYDPIHNDQAAEASNHWPFRLTRFSKYVAGIQTLAIIT